MAHGETEMPHSSSSEGTSNRWDLSPAIDLYTSIHHDHTIHVLRTDANPSKSENVTWAAAWFAECAVHLVVDAA